MKRRRVLLAVAAALGAAGLVILGYLAWPRVYFPEGGAGIDARLDAYLNAVMASRPVPGLAAGVVRGDSLIFARGYGRQNLGAEQAVAAETIFHTASISKTFVALAVMQLVESNRLKLDHTVASVLPYFRASDTGSREITIRHLLAHLSGLPADVEGGAWWESPEHDDGALERYVRTLDRRAVVSSPGGEWHYSNMGYEVLGDVIAKVSGTTFEDYIDEYVLRPLGMTSSTFGPVKTNSGLASPHRGSLMPAVSAFYPYHRAHAPSSTLKSNVPDLGRWLSAQIGRGRLGAATVLSASSLEAMWTPQIAVEGWEAEMTLGWFLRRHRGQRMLLHAGRDPGFNTCVAFLPDRGVGVILLSNYDGQSAFEMVEIAVGMLDVGQGRDPELPKASILIPLARTLARDGVSATIDEYRRLKTDGRYASTPSDLSTLGHELRKQERLEEAIELYTLNAKEHPDYFAPHLFLAESYLKIGDEQKALEHYKRGLECDPEGRWGFPLSEYRIGRLEELMRGGPPS